MAKEKITIGLDVGSSQIKVLVAQYSDDKKNPAGKNVPQILGTGTAPSHGMRRGYIEDIKELTASIQSAIRSAEKSSGVEIKRAEVAVGDCGVEACISAGQTVVGRADQEITELDVTNAIAVAEDALPAGVTQNHRILHRIPVSFRIDGKVVMDNRPVGMKGSKLEVRTLFVTCIESHLSRLARAIEDNNIEISDMVASPIASSISCLSKSQKIAGCILVNIGAETTSIIVYDDNLPVSVEILPLGGQDITNDIALGLKISIEEAEGIKIGAVIGTSVSRKKLDEIIEARLSDIFEMIEKHLKKIGRNAMLPAGIFLTGGGSKTNGIEDFAKSFLKLPVKVVTIPSGQQGKNIEAIWSLSYGLCMLGATREDSGLGMKGIGETGGTILAWLKKFLP